jgi:outer membrane receptor protein involved in Fe transport
VWDLTAEAEVIEDMFGIFDIGLVGGVNNIFDEEYYARITSTGIDPAYRRNIYGGVKVTVG